TDSRCLDIDEGKKTPSDKDVRDLALDKYNIDLSKLQNMEQEIQDEIIKYLKKDREISLRQLSRLTGFTIHRIYKVKV
ncbi:MAG: transposase, partial [Bacillota bacterium]|nr:transposase [Bacillota bacterium]